MKVFDKIFFGIIFWAVLPISLFLIGWWGTVDRVPENRIIYFAFGGLLLGIILNFFFFRKIILNLFELQNSTLSIIYIFYSMCIFGFFMGVPIFNILLGIPAGYYIARRCTFLRKEPGIAEHYIKQVAVFTSIVMFVLCVFSASIALSDPFTPGSLKSMLHLNFDISRMMLFIIIIGGGAILIGLQYYLTKLTAKIIYSISEKAEQTE